MRRELKVDSLGVEYSAVLEDESHEERIESLGSSRWTGAGATFESHEERIESYRSLD